MSGETDIKGLRQEYDAAAERVREASKERSAKWRALKAAERALWVASRTQSDRTLEERRAHSKARKMKALELRRSGLTWAAVGLELGVCGSQAAQLAMSGERMEQAAIRAEVKR